MKIFIVGIVASGKTTLAQKLSSNLKIPHYEGDCIAWGFPGEKRYRRSDVEQYDRVRSIDHKGDWLIERTYRESQKCLFDLAEIIVYLDIPLLT
ncbi:MAG: hypothetical protein ABF651_12150 [Sporolactobacillus sp.]